MRTLIIIVGGLVLWGIFMGGFRMLRAKAATALWAFIAVWFVIAAANMWTGISQAGYSFAEELPIFLVIFLIPAALAFAMRRRLA